jgi:hypothetical protein
VHLKGTVLHCGKPNTISDVRHGDTMTLGQPQHGVTAPKARVIKSQTAAPLIRAPQTAEDRGSFVVSFGDCLVWP